MKILTFSDLHGQLSSLKKLIQLEAHNGYDAILAVGDIGAYGKTRLNAKEVVSMLSAFSCPVLFVLGNSDPEHTVKDVDWPENGVLLSEEPTMLGEYAVVGLNSIYNVSLRTNKTNHDYSDQKFKVLSESITKYKIDPQPESGHRKAQDRKHHCGSIDPGIGLPGGQNAKRNCDKDGQKR